MKSNPAIYYGLSTLDSLNNTIWYFLQEMYVHLTCATDTSSIREVCCFCGCFLLLFLLFLLSFLLLCISYWLMKFTLFPWRCPTLSPTCSSRIFSRIVVSTDNFLLIQDLSISMKCPSISKFRNIQVWILFIVVSTDPFC